MGAVYEAIDTRLGIRVALKESFASGGELRNQFEREARLLASLRHAALPRVTDYFIEGDHSFLVMEFVPGPTLAEVVSSEEGKRFDAAQVVKWADQVLDVLVYLHGQGRRVIHRDIKPHNLKLTGSGGICLIDFGLAKARSDEGRSVHGFTRRYSPIEQIEDRGTTEQSDIYALGATLYHLLTGVKPADAEVRGRVMAAGGADPLVSGHILFPAIDRELSSILDRALAQNAEDRFASASEFREALRQLGRTEVEGLEVLSRRGSRSRLWLIAACVVGALLLGVLGSLLVRSTGGIAPESAAAVISADRPGEAAADEKEPASSKKRERRRVREPLPQRASATSKKGIDSRAAHVRVEVAREKSPLVRKPSPPARELSRPAALRAAVSLPRPAAVRSDEVLRAPDGTEVVKFRDGRVRAFRSGERRP